MKRLIFTLFIGMLGLSAFAQTNYEGFDIYGLDSENQVKKVTFGIELSAGSEAGVGLRLQRNFGKYFAWDIFQFKYTFDYTGDEVDYVYGDYHQDYKKTHKMSITTGIRLFTPTFGNNCKIFAAFGYGYGPNSRLVNFYYYDECTYWTHTHAIDCSIGLQYKKFHIGYGLNSHIGWKYRNTDHTVRLGFNF